MAMTKKGGYTQPKGPLNAVPPSQRPSGEQYELFGGTPPHQVTSPTSRGAAEAIEPRAHTLAAMVYQFILNRSTRGATDKEVQQALGMSVSTQVPSAFCTDSASPRNL